MFLGYKEFEITFYKWVVVTDFWGAQWENRTGSGKCPAYQG